MRKFCFRQLIPILSVAGILLLCSACGGGESSTTSQGTPAGGGSVSQLITAADGGGVALGDSVTLKVPAGALPADATVTITAEDEEGAAPTELDGAKPMGPKFKVDLGGQKPSKPVTLEIAFLPELLPEGTPEDAVFLAYYDEGQKQWVPVGGRVDKERNVVIVETDHLSWWNPFTWNWDAWIAVLHKTLSLRLTDFVQGISLLTGDCSESGQNVTVDNSKGNTVIKGCITKDDAASPELRIVNLKSFYVGLSPAPGGPGYPEATILGPGDAATFTADTSDTPPATVYADFTDAAMWRFVVGLVAEMLPGGDLIPNDGLAYIADGLAMVFSAQEASEDLDAGDAAGAAEHLYELITGDDFIETFAQLAAEYGQEHGVDMMSKWTAAGVKQVFKAVAAVDVIISATDFLANYVFNNHSAVAFSWAGAKPSPTVVGRPTATPSPGAAGLGFRVADFEDPASTRFLDKRDGWRVIAVYLELNYAGGLKDDVLFCPPRNSDAVEVNLEAPNGYVYRLSPKDSCLYLIPGVNLRLHLQGYVPEVLPSINGSKVSVKVGRGLYQSTIPLEKGLPFAHGPAIQAANPFGVPVEAAFPSESGTLKGTYEIVSVAADGGALGWARTRIGYRLANNSGQDIEFPQFGGQVRCMLIDARGSPGACDLYACQVPPGLTEECSMGALTVITADLTDVVLILRFEDGRSDVFRGRGQ